MALVTSSQPSLIGGVSQQPEVLRPSSSAEAQENAYSSVVDGLIKRHPMNHVTQFAWTTDFVHAISRDEVEKYFLCIDDAGVLRVHDPVGNEFFLFEEGLGTDYLSYLSAGTLPAKERFRAVTIADTTIIVNRDVVVEPSPKTGDSPLLEKWRAMVFFKIGAFATQYTIKVRTRDMSDTYTFILKTWKGSDGTQVWIQLSAFVWELRGGGVGASGYFQTSTDLLAEAFRDRVNVVLGPGGTNEVLASAKDGVLMMKAIDQFSIGDSFDPNVTNTDFEVHDGLGNSAMTKIWKSVDRLSDLPRTFLHNYRVDVAGDESDNQDDFTVRFEGEDPLVTDDLQEGKWAEFYQYGSTNRIGVSQTLPLKMIRKFDTSGAITGTVGEIYFELRNDFTVWDEKQAGNDETNPEPSFTGEKINEVFFFDNRLGFLTGQNVVMSGANGFFDFYMETAQAGLLDSDVIDVAAGHTSVAILRNAVPVGSALILMSDLVQFQVLSGEDGILSPKTISLEPVATNESEPLVRPHSFGGAVIFPFTRGLFAGVTEMVPASDARGVWSFNTLTDQVPQYLAGDVIEFAVDNRLGVIVALCAADPSKLYIFKEFLGAEGRLQAAWFRYSLTGSPAIKAINFLAGKLFLHIERGSVTTLETLEFHSSPVDPNSDFMTRLDRRLDETGVTSAVYDVKTDITVITFPYTLGGTDAPVIISRADGTNVAGIRPEVTASDSNSVTVRGDWSSTPFWAGTTYEMLYQFAKPQLRAEEGRGTSAIQTGRIQVTKGTLVHDGTGYFTVGVTLPTRDEVVKSFGPVVSGPGSLVGNLLNAQALQDGRFSFHVMGKADDAVVVVRNDSPFPSNFQKAEWEIQYNSKAIRFKG